MPATPRRTRTRLFLRRFASNMVSALSGYIAGFALIHYPREVFVLITAPLSGFCMLALLEWYGYARVLWSRLNRDAARLLWFIPIRIYGSRGEGISIVISLSKAFLSGFLFSFFLEQLDDDDEVDSNFFFSMSASENTDRSKVSHAGYLDCWWSTRVATLTFLGIVNVVFLLARYPYKSVLGDIYLLTRIIPSVF